jgi:cardiolipin synthase (CMP-forming)
MHLAGIKPWKSLNWPNRISLLRLLLVAPYFILILNQDDRNWWPAMTQFAPDFARRSALVIFIVMAISDALDGFLARRMHARTRLGAILDPMADKVMIICSVVLLSQPYSCVREAPLPNWVVVLVVAKDLWVTLGFLVVYLVTDRFRVRPTLAGKLCTAVQCLMVGFTLLAPELNSLAPHLGLPFALGSWVAMSLGWATAAACVAAAISYTVLGLAFIATEQKPMEDHALLKKNHERH